jgi:hypothetical protein
MEPRPLSEDPADPEVVEARLELVPALDDPEAPEEPEAAEDDDGPAAEELEAVETYDHALDNLNR